MCQICDGGNLEGLEQLDCGDCSSLTDIPNIKGLKELICYGCTLLTNISIIEGLEQLNCGECPLLTNIPDIKGLEELECYSCPLLTEIPNIKELQIINCNDCPLLTNIPDNKRLIILECSSCPLLNIIPNVGESCYYDENLLKLPFEGCKYLISDKVEKLYNNIYYLWKKYQLNKYILYLEIEYSNPSLPYMQYYITNGLYEIDDMEKLKVGYMNSKKKLIWYKFS